MKKFFSLLLCVTAISFASNASEYPMIDQCINMLLGNVQTTQLMATQLDVNHDGVLTIADVSALIDQELQAQQVNRAQARDIDVDAIAKEVIATESGEPTINDVNRAIHQNLKDKE